MIRDNFVLEFCSSFQPEQIIPISKTNTYYCYFIIVQHGTFNILVSVFGSFYRLSIHFSILKMFCKITYDYTDCSCSCFIKSIVQPHIFIILEWQMANKNECKIEENKFHFATQSFRHLFLEFVWKYCCSNVQTVLSFFVIHFLPQHNITQSFKL